MLMRLSVAGFCRVIVSSLRTFSSFFQASNQPWILPIILALVFFRPEAYCPGPDEFQASQLLLSWLIRRSHGNTYPSNRRMSRQALWPPKPKLLLLWSDAAAPGKM